MFRGKKWEPYTDHEIALEKYAIRFMELRKGSETETKPFLEDYLILRDYILDYCRLNHLDYKSARTGLVSIK